jgi:hypothetical protein
VLQMSSVGKASPNRWEEASGWATIHPERPNLSLAIFDNLRA